VAAAIDGARFDELAGSVAGDDTVLIVSRSRPAAQRLLVRLKDMMRE
jgi:transcriptional regulator of arginine metabolism